MTNEYLDLLNAAPATPGAAPRNEYLDLLDDEEAQRKQRLAGTLSTDALGKVTFMLDAGDYYGWVQVAGFNFTNPTTFTVA